MFGSIVFVFGSHIYAITSKRIRRDKGSQVATIMILGYTNYECMGQYQISHDQISHDHHSCRSIYCIQYAFWTIFYSDELVMSLGKVAGFYIKYSMFSCSKLLFISNILMKNLYLHKNKEYLQKFICIIMHMYICIYIYLINIKLT